MLTRFRVPLLVFLASLLSACGTDPGFDKSQRCHRAVCVCLTYPRRTTLVCGVRHPIHWQYSFWRCLRRAKRHPGLERTTKVSYAVGRELQTVAETTF